VPFERIAVTGGSGRLGAHVLDALAGTAELRVIDTNPPARVVRHLPADVTDHAALRGAFAGCDAVVHLAAIPNPRSSTPEQTFRVNTQGTWAVLQAAEDAGVRRVVIASSDSVFGLSYNPPDWMPRYLPVDEAHPLRPSEAYSLSKQVTEVIGRSYAARGRLEVVAIRPTHIVFPPEYPELHARGSDVANYHFWTYVAPEDVAEGFRLALARKRVRWEVFLISAADGLNTRPTLDLVRERWGFVPELRRPWIYEENPRASLLDITHARETLGFAPRGDWRRWVDPGAAGA
jgi:UDP-glucose 4-epimerase